MQAARVSTHTFTHCLRLRPSLSHIRSIVAMSTSPTAIKPKVLVITGPTAVGKTAISLALAERLNGEIISADSVQVYKGLDIGSDKVRLSQWQLVLHESL